MTPRPLDAPAFAVAVMALAAADPELGAIVRRLGPPPFWQRPPGFATLVWIILEQQVSLASARAAFERLLALADPLTPPALLALSHDQLRACGLSRQKARYCRLLAEAVGTGALDLDGLAALADTEARAALMVVPGIGRWTADVYLLMALRRPDIWPVGDLALVLATQRVLGLAERPDARTMERLGQPWRPYRAVATRMLWHLYLSEPAPRQPRQARGHQPPGQPGPGSP